MVNTGKPSKACGTCKARRIKCDEGRPVCQKCRKAKRECLGYPDVLDTVFRDQSKPFRKVDYETPADRPITLLPLSSVHVEIFFEDYVLESRDRTISRGYLDGLNELLTWAGPESFLALAVEAVSLANVGKKTNNIDMLQNAGILYGQALKELRAALVANVYSTETLMTATILGLYESITAEGANLGNWIIHLRGISAVLGAEYAPFDIRLGLFQTLNPLFARTENSANSRGVLVSPCSAPTDPSTKSLDNFYIKARPVFVDAASIFTDGKLDPKAVRELRQRARLLHSEVTLWPLSQTEQWRPRKIGLYECDLTMDKVDDLDIFPGHLDAYFDLYVAAVWNTYRKARLKIIDVLHQCGNYLHTDSSPYEDTRECMSLRRETSEIVKDLCASVPFHLIRDLRKHIDDPSTATRPAKALGGLLLMYPMYVAAVLPLTSDIHRRWILGRLKWIGNVMGIGSVSILSESPMVNDIDFFGSAHLLQWAGSLLQPSMAVSDSPSDYTSSGNSSSMSPSEGNGTVH